MPNMMKFSVFFFLLTLAAEGFSETGLEVWTMVTEPSHPGQNAQSIGSYTAGCLSGGVSLPSNGPGYQVMRLSRKRYYGHPVLKKFIEKLGRQILEEKLGVLLIGDMGQPRGGPTLTGHRSHQTGLDVDIWFLLSKEASSRILEFNERESWSAPSVLKDHSDAIDWAQWTPANEKVLEMAARMPEVDRIFVNPSIKRQLCQNSGAHDWLRKIRPWWKHDDHFHVRLKCPKDSPSCHDQEPLPTGDGCDASLAWWFSEEAKAPAKKRPPPKPPVLPLQCEKVLIE